MSVNNVMDSCIGSAVMVFALAPSLSSGSSISSFAYMPPTAMLLILFGVNFMDPP